MTRDEFLSSLRTEALDNVGIPDAEVLRFYRNRPGFDPSWLAPAAAPASVAPVTPPESPSILRRAGDVGAAVVGGAGAVAEGIDAIANLVARDTNFNPVQRNIQAIPRAAAGIANVVAGRETPGEALREFFTGDVASITDWANSLKSSAVTQAKTERQRAIANAEPLWGFQQLGEGYEFLKATGASPTLLVDLVAEQIPQLIPSALAARGVSLFGRVLSTQKGNLARFGAWLASEKGTTAAGLAAAALQQGGSVANESIADLTAGLAAMSDEEAAQIPQIAALMENGADLESAKASLVLNQASKAGLLATITSGASSAVFGAPLQRLLNRWVSRAPAMAPTVAPSFGERALTAVRTGASEGAQEVIEEVSGVTSGNYFARPVFPDRDIFQGAGVAGAGGFLGGFGMGAGVEAATQFADSAASTEQVQPQGATQARPEQQPADVFERTAPAFVSFDVEQPTVEQPLFVARVSVTDPRANSQEGLIFTGATQEEAELKRDAAGFRPIENMTPEQQVEIANKIRGAAPTTAPGVRPEDLFDGETVAALRTAQLPDEFIAKLSPEAAARIIAGVRKEVQNIQDESAKEEASAQALRTAVAETIRLAAQQADAADAQAQRAVEARRLAGLALIRAAAQRADFIQRGQAEQAAGQPVLPGTEEAVLTHGAPVIGATDMSAVPGVSTAPARGQQTLRFRPSRATFPEDAPAPTELQTEPLSGGDQTPAEQPPIPAPAPLTVESVIPPAAPAPVVTPGAAAAPVIPPPAKTGTETPAPKPGMLDNLKPFPRFAIRDNNATDLDQIDTKGGTAENPVVAMLFTDPSGRLISVPVHRHDNALRVATSSVTDSAALRALTPAQQATLPGKRTITGILGKPSPLEGGKSQVKWDAIFSALETATGGAWSRWGGREIGVFADAMGLTHTGGTVTVSRANGGVGTEITLAPTGNEAPAAETRDASSSRQAVERSTESVSFTNPVTGARGAITLSKLDDMVALALDGYLNTEAGEAAYAAIPTNRPLTEQVASIQTLIESALTWLRGQARGPRRVASVEAALAAIPQLRMSEREYLSMAARALERAVTAREEKGLPLPAPGSGLSTSAGALEQQEIATVDEVFGRWFDAIAPAELDVFFSEVDTMPADQLRENFQLALEYSLENFRVSEAVRSRMEKATPSQRAKLLGAAVGSYRNRGQEALTQTQRPLTPGEQDFIDRTKPEPTIEQFNAFIESANAFGINVTMADMEVALGGRASENFVMLLGAHLTNPGTQTFMALAHEVAHVYANKARPAVRLALHRGIEQLEMRLAGRKDVDPRVGAGSYQQYLATNPANPLTQEEWANEVVVETMAVNGVERNISRGLVAALWRRLKAALLDMQMWFQEQIGGPEAVNEDTARAWLQNQVDSIIAGDGTKLSPYLAQFTVRPTIGQRIQMRSAPGTGWRAEFVDPVTGGVSAMPIIGVSPGAIDDAFRAVISMSKAHSIRTGRANRKDNLENLPAELTQTVRPATDPLREDAVGAVRMLKEEAEAKLAALNELKKPFLAMFNARNAAVPELTDAERAFMRANGETAPTRLPDNAEGYAAFAKELGKATDPFAAAEKIIKDTTAILTEELGTPMPTDFLNVNITIQDIQQASSSRLPAYGLAVEEVVKETKDSHNAIRDHRANRKIEQEQLTKQIERLNVQGNKMVRNPLDWTEVQREMVKSLREYINEIKRNTERVADASGAAEGAAATLSAMIDETERRLITEEALDQVFDNINLDVAQADGSQESFLAVMRDFYGLLIHQNIDVVKTPAKAIREKITEAVAADPDSALRVFTRTTKQGKIQGTALLASVIDFAKREGQVNDIVRAHAERLRGTEEQRAAITRALSEYQDVLLNATEEKIRELAKRPFSNTYLSRFLNGRKALDDAKAALTKVNFELSVLKKADEMYSLVARRADDALNLHTGWTVQHGAPFVDPQSADESIDAMFERTRLSMERAGEDPARSDYALKLVGEGAMTRADLQRIADKIDQWIKANENKPEQRGYKFNTLNLQHRELLHHLHGAKARDFQARWIGSTMSAFANQVASAGTRGGEIAARLLQRADSIKTTYGLEWSARVARKWQVATVALQRAANMKWESVEHHFFRPMTSVSNANMFKDREAFLQEMDALLSEDPALEGIWNKPAVKRAFAEYVEAYAQKAASTDEMARKTGADAVETDIEITDPLTGQKTFAKRNRIERGEITDVSETPAELRSWAALAVTRTETLNALFNNDSIQRFRKDRAELEPLMNKFLGVDGWTQFMRPLLGNIHGGVPAPVDADGAKRTVSSTKARRILETTDNLFDFIEAAYAQRPEGSEQSLGDYTDAVLRYVGSMWSSVRSEVVKDNAEHNVQTAQILVLPRYGIDARVMRNWPREWRVGKTGFEADIRSAVEAVANLASFGPDAVRFRAAISDHKQELGERLAKVQEAMKAMLTKTPANLALGDRIASLKGEDLKVYRRLEKQEREVKEQLDKDWDSILGRVLNRETSWLQSNSWALEVWGLAVTGLVSGLRTALKNPAALLMIPSIGRELSPNSALLGAKAAGNLGKVLAMSFIQSTGLRPGSSDRVLKALHKYKGVDPANQKRLLDAWQAPDRGIQGNLQGLAMLLRRLRTFYSDARFGFSYGGMVPSLRLFNPFSWSQYLTTTAADITLIDAYEGIVSKLAAFEDRGGDLKKPFTADDVGFSGSTNELTNWINQYEASGGSIDVAIRQLRELKRKGDTMSIPENIVMTAARVAVDYVSGESSLSSNPVVFSETNVGKISSTLVGWSIRQAEKVFNVLKNPQGSVDARSFMRGMTLFGIGLLPPILAYSAFLDWTDEETDRKRNKLPLTLTGTPEQAVNGVLEAVSDVGLMGFGWDMFAGLVNPQQAFSSSGDIFSVDNKIVLVSLLRNLTTAIKNAAEVGPRNWTWTGTGREFLAPFGAAGPMANFELLNRVTGEWATGLPVVGSIMEAETARVMRTDANNNIRTAARMVGLPVKTFTTGSYVPKPWNGHVTNMIYAALRDDRAAFREHYDRAVEATRGAVPRGEERESIARTFENRHVWRQTRDPVSAKEIQELLAVMTPDSRESVIRAADLLNRYGSTVGARPFVGAKLTSRGVAERTAARAQGMTVEEFRRSRAGF